MPSNPIGQVVIGFCVLVLGLMALVTVSCLIVGPRHWTRRTCAITARIAGLVLLLLTGVIAVEFANSAFIRGWAEEDGYLFLPVFFPMLPLLGEYLMLKAVLHWRLQPPPPR